MAEKSGIAVLEKNRPRTEKSLFWIPVGALYGGDTAQGSPDQGWAGLSSHEEAKSELSSKRRNFSELSGVFLSEQREDEPLSGMFWKAFPNSFPEFGKNLDQMKSF